MIIVKAARRIGLLILGILLFMTPAMQNNVQGQEQLNPYLLELVEVRATTDESRAEAQNMISRMNNVENSILYQANNNGALFILADTPITDQPEFEHLKGIVPRGHVNSWDEIPGAGGHVSIARIGYSDYGRGHSTINLELHEFGHVADSFTVGLRVSETEEFRAAHSADVDELFGGDPLRDYYDLVEEYFAETFAMYYYTENTRAELAAKAPQTFEFFNTYNHRILSTGQVTGNTVTMTWDLHENAAVYEVYRDGELAGTTTGSAYIIEGLNIDTVYDFEVVAKDKNDKELYTSYSRSALTTSIEDPPDVDTSILEATIDEVETSYTDRDMGESLTRALSNAKSYISNDENLNQDEVDNLNSNLREVWEADETAQREAEEERLRAEQEAREKAEREAAEAAEAERIAAEEQAALEAEEREKAAAEAAQKELQSTIIRIGLTIAAILAVFIGLIFYKKK